MASHYPVPTLVVLALLAACSTGDEEAPSATVVSDSLGIQIVETVEPTGLEGWSIEPDPSVSIGTSEGPATDQLFRVFSALRTADGRVLISTSGHQELRLFESDGSHLASFGSEGEGPGEFSGFSSMGIVDLRGDTVWVRDVGNGRVNVYRLSGLFLTSFVPEQHPASGRPSIAGPFGEDTWLMVAAAGSGALQGEPGEILEGAWDLYRTAFDGSDPQPVLRIPSRPRIVNEVSGITHFPYIPLSPTPAYATDGGTLLVMDGASPEIRRYSPEGEVLAIYRWAGTRRALRDHWDEFRAASLESIGNENQRRLYAHLYDQDLPLPETLPAYASMLVDHDGLIWLERFRLSSDEPPVWDLVAPSGEWLGSMRVPVGLRLFQIGRDFVVGRRVDDLGVESVVVHALSRGG